MSTNTRTVLGKRKRGDDWRFRGIVVNGDDVDLSADGWTAEAAITFKGRTVNLVPDPTHFPDGRVVLTLDRAVTETMKIGTWVGDLEVTGPSGRQSSSSFEVVVVEDQTTHD